MSFALSTHILPAVLVATATLRVSKWTDINFIEALSDDFTTYWLLGFSAIIFEELAPIFGGIAAHEGELKLFRVILGLTIGGWVSTTLLYLAGRRKWEWIRKRFPRIRATGTVALRVVARNPLTASFLVRFAFGLRIVLPMACGAARVPVVTYLVASLVGSALWSTLFSVIGYAAGEAAFRVVGKLDRAGEIIGAIMVTALVFGLVWLNRRRKARKEERRRNKRVVVA